MASLGRSRVLAAAAAGLGAAPAAGKAVRWRPAAAKKGTDGALDMDKAEYTDVVRSYTIMAEGAHSVESVSQDEGQRPTSWGYSEQWLNEVAGITDPASVNGAIDSLFVLVTLRSLPRAWQGIGFRRFFDTGSTPFGRAPRDRVRRRQPVRVRRHRRDAPDSGKHSTGSWVRRRSRPRHRLTARRRAGKTLRFAHRL